MRNMDNASPDGPNGPEDVRDTARDDAVSPPPAGRSAAKDAKGAAEAPDLTAQIVAAVAKEAGDVVRCTRVGRDTYRCNWWAPQAVAGYDNPALPGRLFATHRVRKSEFMEVSRSRTGLLIRVVPDASAGRRALVADA